MRLFRNWKSGDVIHLAGPRIPAEDHGEILDFHQQAIDAHTRSIDNLLASVRDHGEIIDILRAEVRTLKERLDQAGLHATFPQAAPRLRVYDITRKDEQS